MSRELRHVRSLKSTLRSASGNTLLPIHLLTPFTCMKIFTPFLFSLLLWSCAGGTGAQQVSASQFQEEYAWVGQPQSMHSVTYLGQRDGQAFLCRRSMSALRQEWSDQLLYVELAELAPAFRESLPRTEMTDAR